MAEALKHIGELRLHHPDLTDLQYLTQLSNAHSASTLGAYISGWLSPSGAPHITSLAS